ncbi:hypothetical protein F4809DRAFT_174972 [Biscogniauxia mediterranea]|nr:hypothetical protein F4809DRAFT_174972 [Biscogniauxia mediterranea]
MGEVIHAKFGISFSFFFSFFFLCFSGGLFFSFCEERRRRYLWGKGGKQQQQWRGERIRNWIRDQINGMHELTMKSLLIGMVRGRASKQQKPFEGRGKCALRLVGRAGGLVGIGINYTEVLLPLLLPLLACWLAIRVYIYYRGFPTSCREEERKRERERILLYSHSSRLLQLLQDYKTIGTTEYLFSSSFLRFYFYDRFSPSLMHGSFRGEREGGLVWFR